MELKSRSRGLHFGTKIEKKMILAGIENRFVFNIDFGRLFGLLLEPKFQLLSLTFCYTFENLCQGGSWDGSGGSWTILGRLWGVPGMIFGSFLTILVSITEVRLSKS